MGLWHFDFAGGYNTLQNEIKEFFAIYGALDNTNSNVTIQGASAKPHTSDMAIYYLCHAGKTRKISKIYS